jgi:hypothetical protein
MFSSKLQGYQNDGKQKRNSLIRATKEAAENAKRNKVGLWKLCPGSKLNPYSALQTDAFKSSQSATAALSNTACDANYGGCVAAYPPDLDCTDIKRLNLAPVKVIGRDLHKLDREGDGIGCDK